MFSAMYMYMAFKIQLKRTIPETESEIDPSHNAFGPLPFMGLTLCRTVTLTTCQC